MRRTGYAGASFGDGSTLCTQHQQQTEHSILMQAIADKIDFAAPTTTTSGTLR
jgi:hypothetical protein